jgi:hypothetical protein
MKRKGKIVEGTATKTVRPENQIIIQDVEHRLFSLKSFLCVLKLIEKKVEPQEIIQYVPSKIYIEAICFELILKIFYLLDKNQRHPTDHSIKDIFNNLNDETKKLIEQEFNNKIIEPTKEIAKKHGKALDVPDFQKTLSHNKKIVTNFKYDLILKNGSIVNTAFIESLYAKIESRIDNN